MVTKSVPENTVVEGNPAKFIIKTDELMNKYKELIKESKTYDKNWLIQNGITNIMKKQTSNELENNKDYVI
jgi:maltose O-acetyltransferase